MSDLPKIDPKQIRNLPETLQKLDGMIEIKSLDPNSLKLDESKRLTVIGDGSGGVNKQYVDSQDTSVLTQAKKYTDDTKSSLARVARTGNYQDLNGKPNLKPVATSGSFNDLTDKPTSLGGKTVLVEQASDLPDEGEDGATYLVKNNALINTLLDAFYPVGTYYETSDIDFDPNTTWGGTWEEDSAGRVLVALDDSTFNYTGKTGGSETHHLTINEMPRHRHSIRYSDNGKAITMSTTNTGPDVLNIENFQWRKNTNANDTLGGNIYAEDVGNTQPHNNLQPYLVVKRWHRTA